MNFWYAYILHNIVNSSVEFQNMGMVNENLQLSFIQAELYKYSLFSAATLNLGFLLALQIF